MKIRDIIVEADPSELGYMNAKMAKLLRDVHTGDVEQAQSDAEAKAKAKADQRAEAARLRKENPEMLQQYIDMLKKHDWTYEYSDGYSREYTKGRDERYDILNMAKKIDPDLEIYNKYDPLKKESIGESGPGVTTTSDMGIVINPHYSPGKARGKKSYIGNPRTGESGSEAPPQPKVNQPKEPDGTAKPAHKIKGASLFGGPAVVKR